MKPTKEMIEAFILASSTSRGGTENCVSAGLTAALAAMPTGEREVVRHKKRGTTYEVIARGRLQVDGDLDNEKVIVYRSQQDGAFWVRPEYEFNDGRFGAVSSSTMPSDIAAENELPNPIAWIAPDHCRGSAFDIGLNQPIRITFGATRTAGTLTISDGKMTFEGNTDDAARVLIHSVIAQYDCILSAALSVNDEMRRILGPLTHGARVAEQNGLSANDCLSVTVEECLAAVSFIERLERKP
ncbi:MAG: hypothetical protein QMD99_13710 [Rhizobiaceae bacterium]|nr:hypothetical protein [Rhizobiaceae bacterium]